MSKVQKFCNLYVFVKKENPELFEILEDMCAIGLFTSRHPVTFINPSKEVTDSLVDLVNKGKVDIAFEHLQKHFIYGKHTSLAKGPFVTYNQKMMKTDLSKNTKVNKVFTQWKSDNVSVFDQTNSGLLEEGDQAERPKLEKKKVGSSEGRTKQQITEILQERSKNANNMHAFAYAVNGLLVALEDSDSSKFEEVKRKLDPNPVVCWYILVKPSTESKYISDELFSEWTSTFDENINNKNVSALKSAFECDGYGSDHIAKAREARSSLNDSGLKNLVDSIVASYDDETELIEDELRFRFTDYDYEGIELHFSELDNLTWSLEDAILCKTNNTLLCKPIYETIKKFIESNCFHYSMYDQSTHKKFEEFVQGAGASSKKIIKILGSEGRKLITSLKAEDELAKLVSSLSKKQVASLKKILKA